MTSPNNNKLLFIYTNFSMFVKEDYNILKTKYDVTKYHFSISSNLKIIFLFIKQFFWLIFNINKYQKVYIWFGDYHSFLPILFCRIFNIQSYLVIGGYDVCHIPEFHYGSFKNKLRGFCTLYSMNNCTMNLSVSRYVDRKVRAIAKKSKSTIIYNGISSIHKDSIDTDYYAEKENMVLTVGVINSKQRIKIKGIDFYIEIAKHMPVTKFMIVGASEDLIKDYLTELPDNLIIKDFCEPKELAEIYKKSNVYCQFSIIESFCVTLAEAMFYGCIPVVTNVGAMPEIINNKKYISKKDINDTVKLIEDSLKFGSEERQINAERIRDNFLLKHRRDKLLEVI